jgi:penicillin amidase
MDLSFLEVETVPSLEAAFRVAHQAGIPAQNFVAADTNGHIGWTIAGRIPRRVGFDGRLPVSWADGTRGWHGWHAGPEYPRVVDPPDGRVVTANNRLVGGPALTMLGDGGYDPGARARQIRDRLSGFARARVADMRDVQLDDRALLMERWRQLALGALTAEAVADHPERREFRRLILDGWSGRASIDSVGYRLVRQFRSVAAELVLEPFVARMRRVDPRVTFPTGRGTEGPVWTLLTERPLHLLPPGYRDWTALVLEAVDAAVARLTDDGRALQDRTWGEANTTRIEHPLGRGLPVFGWWLNMTPYAVPGDAHMPRVQGVTFGASERFAVSPGLEAEGYFHMPAGQSGHPLSRHYRDSHLAWIRGEPMSFLPGPTVTRLVLRPSR